MEKLELWYFYSDDCTICQALWPKVKALTEGEFPELRLKKLKALAHLELAGQHRMLSVPGILVFVEGREYFRVDNLNWIQDGLLENIMDMATIKMGLMEINYGDYHFRRSDNARAIYNPFVGNLIMDAFNTEAGAELYFTPGDFLIMAGITNGKLNQSVATDTVTEYTPAFLAKLG